MGGGGSSAREIDAVPTQAPKYKENYYGIIDNFNNYKRIEIINLAVFILAFAILLFHLYLKSKLK